MPHISELKDSKYLRKEDCTPPILVTIKGWEQHNVARQNEPQEMKYCLTFEEAVLPFVLNSTNGQIIAAICGSDEIDHWAGHKIVLYNDPNISFGGKLTGGIRARAPKAQAAPRQAAAPGPVQRHPAPAPARPVPSQAVNRPAPARPAPAPVQEEAPIDQGYAGEPPPEEDGVPFRSMLPSRSMKLMTGVSIHRLA